MANLAGGTTKGVFTQGTGEYSAFAEAYKGKPQAPGYNQVPESCLVHAGLVQGIAMSHDVGMWSTTEY